MAYRTRQTRGVYCIETVWYGDDDRTSVRPVLQLLEDLYGAPYIHRDAATKDELFHYLTKWQALDPKDYPILYLGFHGSEDGKIWLETSDGKKDMVNYEVLQDQLWSSCNNRLVHFGSCGSLAGVDWDRFLEQTRASAVSGYHEDVAFEDSAAFELVYLADLQYHHGKSLTPTVAETVHSNMTKRGSPYRGLSSYLEFVMHVKS